MLSHFKSSHLYSSSSSAAAAAGAVGYHQLELHLVLFSNQLCISISAHNALQSVDLGSELQVRAEMPFTTKHAVID